MSEILPIAVLSRKLPDHLRPRWRTAGPASAELKQAVAKLYYQLGEPLNFRIDDAGLARAVREQAAWAGKPVETFIADTLRDTVRRLDLNWP